MKALIDADIITDSHGYQRRSGGYGKGSRYIHHYVMEEKIGRPLEKGEVVHHIDHDKSNNNPNNLLLCKSKKEHQIVHAKDLIRSGEGDPETHSWCTFHKTSHFKNEFYKNNYRWNGLSNFCKEAQREYRKLKRTQHSCLKEDTVRGT